jgi:hypothetical protein
MPRRSQTQPKELEAARIIAQDDALRRPPRSLIRRLSRKDDTYEQETQRLQIQLHRMNGF